MSYLEGVFSRGDRKILPAIITAARLGCFDSWSESFSWQRWRDAFAAHGIDPASYVERERGKDEVLPWDHLDAGVKRDFLWEEYLRSQDGRSTPDCRFDECSSCGACSEEGATIRSRLEASP
jgi:hypothetical protein